MRVSARVGLVFGVAATMFLAGCTVGSSMLPLVASQTPTPRPSGPSTPTPSSGITIPVDAPQPTARITSWERVTTPQAEGLSSSETATVYVCVGPDLLSKASGESEARVAIWGTHHELLYSKIVPIPSARVIRIPSGNYYAQIASVNAQTGRVDGSRASASHGRLTSVGYIYLFRGNGCPSSPDVHRTQ